MPVGRPPRRLTDGTPISRIGYRWLTAVDKDGTEHELISIDEAEALSLMSRDTVEVLMRGGAIAVMGSSTRLGMVLVSKRDILELRSQLAGQHERYAQACAKADERMAKATKPKARPAISNATGGPRIGRPDNAVAEIFDPAKRPV